MRTHLCVRDRGGKGYCLMPQAPLAWTKHLHFLHIQGRLIATLKNQVSLVCYDTTLFSPATCSCSRNVTEHHANTVPTSSNRIKTGHPGAIPAESALSEAGSGEFFVWLGVSWRFEIRFGVFRACNCGGSFPGPPRPLFWLAWGSCCPAKRIWKNMKEKIETEQERKSLKRSTKGIHWNSWKANIRKRDNWKPMPMPSDIAHHREAMQHAVAHPTQAI